MSYLDPRAGQSAGDDTSVPAWHAGEDVPTGQLPLVPASDRNVPASDRNVPAPEHIIPTTEQKPQMGRRRAKGRAGRNLPAAIGVGVGLVLVVLGSLVIWPDAFLGVIALASAVGVYEMVRALRATGADAPLIPLVAGSLLMVGLAWREGPDALLLGLLVTIAASVIWRIADGVAAFRRDFVASVMISIYVPFLLSFGVLLQLPDAGEDGQWRVLCTLLAVVLSDTGGYAVGVFFGKHKMAPSISPGKTWEGFTGSVVSAAVGSALLLHFLLDIPWFWGVLFGALLSVVAVAGDLAESMLKRDLGLKDMSNLLPGHGGLMDRLDSILFAVPTAYLLFALIGANT
ncbi:phosphatidate cytidylyltransferase [Paractinoplanes abujensis]|nr:phosphatidate cytidylyltransferase [Actinoplanes abujensis]GID18217.1 phosphatidate cytidylyltransferase [Actinoplanes abujensis]